jgi:hypothetical protein
MHGILGAQRRSGDLAAAVRYHLVNVHIELGSAAGHPHMQRKLVLVLTSQDLVAGLDNQLILAIPEPPARMIDLGCGLLQRRIGNDHFTRHQVVADTEVL